MSDLMLTEEQKEIVEAACKRLFEYGYPEGDGLCGWLDKLITAETMERFMRKTLQSDF